MLSAVEKYAPGPGKKCAIDTLFEVLRAAGKYISVIELVNKVNYITDEILYTTIYLF